MKKYLVRGLILTVFSLFLFSACEDEPLTGAFVTEEEADRLVELGKDQGYERSADVGKENPDGSHDSLVSNSRTSHNTWCQEPSCYEDELVAPVIKRIAEVTQTSVQNSEYLQLLQYEPGQYYKQRESLHFVLSIIDCFISSLKHSQISLCF